MMTLLMKYAVNELYVYICVYVSLHGEWVHALFFY